MGYDGRIEVEGCDTIPKLFWHQVKARDGRTAFREKDLGIWRATSWREYGERASAAGMGLVKLGLQRGEVVSILAETVPEWLYADMGTMGAGGVTNGIYPTDSAKQVEYILNDSRIALPVRRERGAARQVPRGARALPDHRQGLRLRHGGPGRLQRPAWSCRSTSCWRSAARTTRPTRACGRSWSRPRRPRSWRCWSTPPARPARPRARCSRTATSSSSCATPTPSSRSSTDDEQLAFLPLCHVAERTFTAFLPLRSGAIANFAESVETVPDERARGGADHLLRRAAHLGALLFRHRHPHEGGDLDRPHRLQVGARHRPQGRRGRARRPQARPPS